MRPVADPWTGRMGDVMDNRRTVKRLAERLAREGFPVTTRNVNYRDDERHGLSLSGGESEASC